MEKPFASLKLQIFRNFFAFVLCFLSAQRTELEILCLLVASNF